MTYLNRSLAVALTCTVVVLFPATAQVSLARGVVVIDAGHGGDEAGVEGAEGQHEKRFVLRAALLLAEALVEQGYDVRLTRTGDYSVSWPDRMTMFAADNPAALISLHINGDEDLNKTGGELYYHADDSTAARLANDLTAALQGLPIAFVQPEAATYDVFRQSAAPVAMIEMGYLTNVDERAIVTSDEYYNALAAHIIRGLDRFLQHN